MGQEWVWNVGASLPAVSPLRRRLLRLVFQKLSVRQSGLFYSLQQLFKKAEFWWFLFINPDYIHETFLKEKRRLRDIQLSLCLPDSDVLAELTTSWTKYVSGSEIRI